MSLHVRIDCVRLSDMDDDTRGDDWAQDTWLRRTRQAQPPRWRKLWSPTRVGWAAVLVIAATAATLSAHVSAAPGGLRAVTEASAVSTPAPTAPSGTGAK